MRSVGRPAGAAADSPPTLLRPVRASTVYTEVRAGRETARVASRLSRRRRATMARRPATLTCVGTRAEAGAVGLVNLRGRPWVGGSYRFARASVGRRDRPGRTLRLRSEGSPLLRDRCANVVAGTAAKTVIFSRADDLAVEVEILLDLGVPRRAGVSRRSRSGGKAARPLPHRAAVEGRRPRLPGHDRPPRAVDLAADVGFTRAHARTHRTIYGLPGRQGLASEIVLYTDGQRRRTGSHVVEATVVKRAP